MLLKNWLARYRFQWAGRPLLSTRRRPTAVPVARIERCEERTLLSATLVKDIRPGQSSSLINPDSLAIGNTLYFQASDGTTSYELWKSDGTTAGTVLVKDINPGANGSGPSQFVNRNGTLYFVATDGTHGYELWKSDGTSAGTVMVKDINPGSEGGNITSLILVGNQLYFSAWSGTGDYGIWKSDGTEAGTTVVKSFPDVYDNQVAQSVIEVVELNGKALFSVRFTSSQNGIWITDGTEAGTTLLSANGGQHTDADFGLTKVGNSVFFTRQVSPSYATHLWKTDGTIAGTVQVKANMPYLSKGLDLNGKLIYLTSNNTLTVSDGTSQGTFSLSSSVTGFEKYFLDMVVFNNLLYFQDGTKLWKTDGTTAGTVIADPDVSLSNNYGSVDIPVRNSIIRTAGGQLFFTAIDSIRGLELYRSNGLPGGSEIVADIDPGSGTGVSYTLSANSDSLFLYAGDPLTYGNELYKVPLVEPVVNNAAPVLDPAGNPTLDYVVEETPAVNNSGTLVSTIVSRMNPGGITDADSGAQIGIAIIGANQVTGTWQYSFNNGTSWNDFGSTSLAASLLLASDASTRVRYLPNNNFAGNPGFTFVAWDRTTGAEGQKVPTTIRGGTTPFSLAAEDAFITVSNTQDAPFLDPASLLKLPNLNEDTPSGSNAGVLISTLITSYTSGSGITDPDPGTGKGIALVGVDQTNGLWQFSTNNGTSWTNVGNPGPSAALLLAADSNTRLRFFSNLNYFGTAGFTFRAWDRTSGTNGTTSNIPTWTNASAFSFNQTAGSITVVPSNDPPTEILLSKSSVEEQLPVGTFVGLFTAVDIDPNPSFSYALVSGTGSTDNASFTLAANSLKTNQVFDRNVKSSYSIRVRVTDNQGGTFEKVFTIAVTPSVAKQATFGVFRNGSFYLDANRNRQWNGTTNGDSSFGFSVATDIPIAGDWNGDGKTDIGVVRNGSFYLDANGSRSWDGTSGGDYLFNFGNPSDKPVTGDWNGDGKTDIGVWRNGIFYLDYNGNRLWDGVAGGDVTFGFGSVTDTPVTGDWNGDGKFDVGVYRGGTFYLDANGNRTWNGPTNGDAQFGFAAATDIPVTGDWNGDGTTDVGAYRNGTFYIDLNGNRKWDNTTSGDAVYGFAAANDIPLIGTWGPQNINQSAKPASQNYAFNLNTYSDQKRKSGWSL